MSQKQQEKPIFKKRTRRILYGLIWFGAFSPVLLLWLLFTFQSEDDLPSIEDLENPPELLASVVLADDGKSELGRYYAVNRTSVEYKEISPFVFDALISTEDERYETHSGIDFRAVARAATSLGKSGGASTISQQLAKLIYTLDARKKRNALLAEGKDVSGPSGKVAIYKKRLKEKVIENIVAVRLEEGYTKKEIITMYLNQFDFLYNAVGIENASKVYFNKKPKDLTRNEAAMLVGMCNNPSLYNPYRYQVRNYRKRIAVNQGIDVSKVSLEQIAEARAADSTRAMKRKNLVLKLWRRNSSKENPALITQLSEEEYQKLILEPVPVDYQIVDHKEGLAPYFRESLRSDLKKLFSETDENGDLKIQKADGSSYNIYQDGLKIYTTINIDLQQHAENALSRHMKENVQPKFNKQSKRLKHFPFAGNVGSTARGQLMNSGRKQSERFRSMKAAEIPEDEILKSFDEPTHMTVFSWKGDLDTMMTPNDSIRYYKSILRAGLISIEPSTGFVKAWVGGIDSRHFAFDHVKQGTRQVGSTIKPFVYGTALSMGVVKPCTTFPYGSSFCVDTYDDNGDLTKQWCPEGKLEPKSGKDPSVAWCLANSNNPGTVGVMSKMGGQTGPQNIAKLLESVDINLRQEDIVPSMCLGVMDLSLYQMVAAQSMFVNQGIYNRPNTILRIEDRNGNIIYSADAYSKEVMNSTVAYEVLKMMRGVVQFGTGVSLRGSYYSWGGVTQPTAGKTGTTQNNSDGWFMGLTPDLVTGVWVGAEDRAIHFARTNDGQGARTALPIYGYYMQKVYKDRKIKISTEEFEVPIGYNPDVFKCEEAQVDFDLLN